jgi:RAP1 GTPase activating protein 1
MFHVATFLPYKPEDSQQLEKKRHIGNDLVTIIFQQGNDVFELATIASQQNHVIAIVQPHQDSFKVTFVYKNGVPAFSPDLPSPTILLSDNVSRDFFLHKRNILLIFSGKCREGYL